MMSVSQGAFLLLIICCSFAVVAGAEQNGTSPPRVKCDDSAEVVERKHWELLQSMEFLDVDVSFEASGCGRCGYTRGSIVPYSCSASFYPRTYAALADLYAERDGQCDYVATARELCVYGCAKCTSGMATGLEVNTLFVRGGILVNSIIKESADDRRRNRSKIDAKLRRVYSILEAHGSRLFGDISMGVVNLPSNDGIDFTNYGAVMLLIWVSIVFYGDGASSGTLAMVVVVACIWAAKSRKGVSSNLVAICAFNIVVKAAFVISLVFDVEFSVMPFIVILVLLVCLTVGSAFARSNEVDVQYVMCLVYVFLGIVQFKDKVSLSTSTAGPTALLNYVIDSAIPLGDLFSPWVINRTRDILNLIDSKIVVEVLPVPVIFLVGYIISAAMYCVVRAGVAWHLVKATLPDDERIVCAFVEGFAGWGRFLSIMSDLIMNTKNAKTGSELGVVLLKSMDVLYAPDLALLSIAIWMVRAVFFRNSYRAKYVAETEAGEAFVHRIEQYKTPASRPGVRVAEIAKMVLSSCVVSVKVGAQVYTSCCHVAKKGTQAVLLTARHVVGDGQSMQVTCRQKIGGEVRILDVPIPATVSAINSAGDPIVRIPVSDSGIFGAMYPEMQKREKDDVSYLVCVRPSNDDVVYVTDFAFGDNSGTFSADISAGDSGSPIFGVMKKTGDIKYVGCISAGVIDDGRPNRMSVVYASSVANTTAMTPPPVQNFAAPVNNGASTSAGALAITANGNGPTVTEVPTQNDEGSIASSIAAGLRFLAANAVEAYIPHLRTIAAMLKKSALDERDVNRLSGALSNLYGTLGLSHAEGRHIVERARSGSVTYASISHMLRDLFPDTHQRNGVLATLHGSENDKLKDE